MPRPAIVYVECKADGLEGPARIQRARWSRTGRTLYLPGLTLASLSGGGYKANFFDVDTREGYWVSAPRRDGNDSLYPATVEVDVDVRDAYWTHVRRLPERLDCASYRAPGKHRRSDGPRLRRLRRCS